MCGIAGYIGTDLISRELILKTLHLMKRRGPDYSNNKSFEFNNDINVNLLHSRLSIIDLDQRSNQPFSIYPYTLIFNGEIYNYKELRSLLIKRGVKFKTSSDTEVLLQMYINYGDSFFKYLEGMWSLAIWDDYKKKLLISRDRFGEKPLYYYSNNKGFYFGSEIKFISQLSSKEFNINHDKISNYIFQGFKGLNKNSDTYFKEIFSFPSSSYGYLDFKNYHKPKIQKFWQLNYKPKNISFNQAVEKTDFLLKKSIKMRLRSDVPLGFCLSGGIDSNTIVSIAKKKFNVNFNTFSIIEKNSRYNELDNITKSQKYLKLNHKNIFVGNKKNILDDFEKLINYYEEPIATSNYFYQSYLMKEIKKSGIKVIFSGTGSDEIFSGYYDHILQYLFCMREKNNFPKILKEFEKKALSYINNPIFKDPYYYFKNKKRRDHIYPYLDYKNLLIKRKNISNFFEANFSKDLMRNRMLNELFHEGVPVCLNSEDKNAMFYSIENRSPFLDKDLVEFLYTVPTKHLMKYSSTKSILREVAKDKIHKDIYNDHEKKGFNVSVDSLFNLDNFNLINEKLGKNNVIFDLINKKNFENIIKDKKNLNLNSKFIFSVLSSAFFLKKFS